MQMYRWSSSLLKNYRPGDILVLAIDVEEARQLARDHFDTWLSEARSWLYPDDEEDRDEIAELRSRLETDLAAEPQEERLYFISGGE